MRWSNDRAEFAESGNNNRWYFIKPEMGSIFQNPKWVVLYQTQNGQYFSILPNPKWVVFYQTQSRWYFTTLTNLNLRPLMFILWLVIHPDVMETGCFNLLHIRIYEPQYWQMYGSFLELYLSSQSPFLLTAIQFWYSRFFLGLKNYSVIRWIFTEKD